MDDVSAEQCLILDAHRYHAHPHLAVLGSGTWLLIANRGPRRTVTMHPPQDPEYRNVLMRSEDEGRSWSAAAVVPDYGWNGVECAGLTALKSGRALLNQWRFEWLPLPEAASSGRGDLVLPERLFADLVRSPELDAFCASAAEAPAAKFPWARGGGVAAVHLSDDGGRTFFATHRIATGAFSGGYGMRGGVELPNGDIILPLSDAPSYRQVYVVRSRDGGQTWSSPRLAAAGDGHEFEEPAPLLLPSGRIVLALRDNATRRLHCVASTDGGETWSQPRPTKIEGYPAHLLRLADGRYLCVVGRRRTPFAIVAYFSDDAETWGPAVPVVDDLLNKDLGYPTVAQRKNGDLAIVYYAQDRDGVTGIEIATARLAYETRRGDRHVAR